MASGSGHSGIAGGDGKRKRSEGRSRGVCGSGLSDATKKIPFAGVRTRHIVEIKNFDGSGRDFYMDVNGMEALMYGERELLAAIVHDFARHFGNPKHLGVFRPNISRVERLIRKQDLADGDLISGKLFDEFVRDSPLVRVNADAGSDEFKALKIGIAELALRYFKDLKAKIAEEHFRAGCRRQDEFEILPSMEGVEHMEELEIQHLKDQIACLEATHAADLDAKDAVLMAKEAESRGKDITIAYLEEALQTVQGDYVNRTC